jgi:DNA-binding transcriptional LysR family regulator
LSASATKVHNWIVIDWNDVRYFLEVARRGSTLAAAKVLHVSQPTVHRRIAALERAVGCRLVERHPTGYRLTEIGHKLQPIAEQLEAAALGFERHALASDTAPTGVIRVTCAEPVGYRLVRSPLFDRFHHRHSRVRIELVMSDRHLDLGKGEADVAIRAGASKDERLVGRKIADSPWAVYASHAYVARNGCPASFEELQRHGVIAFDDAIAEHHAAGWLKRVAPNARVAARSNSIPGLLLAVKSGVGLAPVPSALAEGEKDLVRLLSPIPELATTFYLLTHPDLRDSPRVSAFFDFINSEIGLVRAVLTGEHACIEAGNSA